MSAVAGRGTFATGTVPRMLIEHARAQWLSYLRTVALSVVSVVLPVLLFSLVGISNAATEVEPGVSFGAYFLASMAAYAVCTIMVFNFGVTLATERAQKVDVLVRASPVPPLVYLAARTATALFFSLVALVVLFVYAYATAGIQLTLDRWLALGAALLVGSVPFIGLGFAISYLASPNAAVAIANLVVLLLAFSSGIFIQFDQLPEVVRVVAPYLPMYHFARLGWGIVGLSGESLPTSAVWLSGYAVALFALALYGYRRLERRRFH